MRRSTRSYRGKYAGSRRRWLAVSVAASLLAAACGGDDGSTEGAETGGSIDTGVKDAVQSQLASTTSEGATTSAAAAQPTTWAEWEAQGAKQREATVTKIKNNKWGVGPDKMLRGPGGWTVDLNKCPAGWNAQEGLTDTEIKIGHTFPYSGTLAEYGNIGRGMKNYFNYIGAIPDSTGKSRKINFLEKDDGYDPARTIPLVDELMDSEKVFALTTGGSPSVMKTYDKINLRCVPQPIAITGHPAWGDPVNHPWTTGYQLAYHTEAILWGNYIEQTLPKGSLVTALIMNNDFGKAYQAGFQAFLAQSKHELRFEFELIEPTAPTITNEMTTLAAKKPDVFIVMTAGTSCTQAITESAQNGLKESAKQLWQPSVCKGSNFVGKDKVGGDGSASNGWLVVGGGVIDFNDPVSATLPQIVFAVQQLAKDGYVIKSSAQFGNGYVFGYVLGEYIQVASQLDGGLTRPNLMLAIRAMDFTSPFMMPGIKLNMNGAKDAYMVEGSEIGKYDSAKQSFSQVAPPVDLSGKSSNCVWDQSIANCKS